MPNLPPLPNIPQLGPLPAGAFTPDPLSQGLGAALQGYLQGIDPQTQMKNMEAQLAPLATMSQILSQSLAIAPLSERQNIYTQMRQLMDQAQGIVRKYQTMPGAPPMPPAAGTTQVPSTGVPGAGPGSLYTQLGITPYQQEWMAKEGITEQSLGQMTQPELQQVLAGIPKPFDVQKEAFAAEQHAIALRSQIARDIETPGVGGGSKTRAVLQQMDAVNAMVDEFHLNPTLRFSDEDKTVAIRSMATLYNRTRADTMQKQVNALDTQIGKFILQGGEGAMYMLPDLIAHRNQIVTDVAQHLGIDIGVITSAESAIKAAIQSPVAQRIAIENYNAATRRRAQQVAEQQGNIRVMASLIRAMNGTGCTAQSIMDGTCKPKDRASEKELVAQYKFAETSLARMIGQQMSLTFSNLPPQEQKDTNDRIQETKLQLAQLRPVVDKILASDRSLVGIPKTDIGALKLDPERLPAVTAPSLATGKPFILLPAGRQRVQNPEAIGLRPAKEMKGQKYTDPDLPGMVFVSDGKDWFLIPTEPAASPVVAPVQPSLMGR